MGLLKSDFSRFFAFGFAAGALLVAAMVDGGLADIAAGSVVPVAEAAAAN